MSASTPKRGKLAITVVVLIAAMGACVPCIGVVAAIAIPNFISYVRRAKTAEATANVRAITSGVVSAYEMERVSIDGSAISHVLPSALPATPAIPGRQRQAWPAIADPGWATLGFAPAEPVYYSYEYTPDADGRGFVVRARGDLDGDGTLSSFETRGRVDASGELVIDPIAITHEIE